MGIRFRNPENDYEERADHPGLWCLLFGPIYFAVKGIWTHAVASFVLACVTAFISWFIYPFFARAIVERHYRRLGWVRVGAGGLPTGSHKECPQCAETIMANARICKHCKSALLPDPHAEASTGRYPDGMEEGLGSLGEPPPQTPNLLPRAIVVALAFLIAATAALLYWKIVEPSAPLSELTLLISFAGAAIVFVVIVVGCWIRHHKMGLFELGAILIWFSLGPMVGAAKHVPPDLGASSQPSGVQVPPHVSSKAARPR